MMIDNHQLALDLNVTCRSSSATAAFTVALTKTLRPVALMLWQMSRARLSKELRDYQTRGARLSVCERTD